MRNIILGIALLAGFSQILFITRARNGKSALKSDFAAQVVALGLVAILMAAGGFIMVGIVGGE